jgi:excinuclease ABC subunit C
MTNDFPAASTFKPEDQEFPPCPGVYLFKDKASHILYVGKAKNLRNRLRSYFRASRHLSSKTRAMVAKVGSVGVLCTTTEKEALLLEAGLIKKHRPRYNICLRDDKQYILFKLDAQAEYPRLILTRRVVRDGALYFGPFTSALAARKTLKAVHRLFPLRRCKDAVFRNRVRPCLYHHLGQCLGPCVLDVSKDAYADLVRRVRLFLAGRSGELVAHLKAAMQEHADRQEYEKAAQIRDLWRGVNETLEQQAVVLRDGLDHDGLDRDVVGLVEDERGLGVSVLFVRQGRLLDSRSFFWPSPGQDAPEQDALLAEMPHAATQKEVAEPGAREQEIAAALESLLIQFYGPEQFIPGRIILPVSLKKTVVAEILAERRGAEVRVEAARGKAEKRLLEMAKANASQAMRKEPDTIRMLGDALKLPHVPQRIEAVDVSHLSGQGTVVGLVVFERGEPLKSAYRVYSFPDQEGGGDDYLALARWTERRVASGPPWPDLLLVDGGLGQLEAVRRALEQVGIDPPWSLVGMAKAGRRAGELRDRIFKPGRKNPLPLKPGCPELLFLQRLRDEVHRFTISRQRLSRKKTTLDSRLMAIKGVGPHTAKLLWNHFPDLNAMRRATLKDLAALPGLGAKRAAKLQEALRNIT